MAQSKKNTLNDFLETMGRVPPHAEDIERAVLGTLMAFESFAEDNHHLLKPDVFYNDTHRKIYAAIDRLVREQKKVDVFTVKEELEKEGSLEEVGGLPYLISLSTSIGSPAHLDYHIKILVQKYIQRELIRLTAEIQTRAFDPSYDVDELLDYSERMIFDLTYGTISNDAQPFNQVVDAVVKEIETISQSESHLTGVPSGYPSLDRVTGGWQKSDLIIVAARPSMGKTAFVVNMTRNLSVEYRKPVAFFTLEMPAEQIALRMMSIQAGIPMNKLRTGQLEKDEWLKFEQSINNEFMTAPLLIDDTPQLSLFELRAKARRLKSKYDISMVVVDYLQLMTLPSEGRMNREQVVSQISRGLKAIAKELSIPVIALSQLNRSVEMRGGSKRPQLADLRESGAIEQDADMVIFLHRPEYYGIKEDAEGNPMEGIAEIIIAKHRNGPLADIKLRFIKEYAKFEEVEDNVLADLDNYEVTTLGSKMNTELAGEDQPELDDGFFTAPSDINNDFLDDQENDDLPSDIDFTDDEILF